MNTLNSKIRAVALGFALALASVGPAMADDSEIYLSASPATGTKPNVLLIVDNSGSMSTRDATGERNEYNPSSNYATSGNCTNDRIFFRRKGEAQPDCSSTNYIERTASNCQQLSLATAVGSSGGRSGRWTGKAARFDTGTNTWSDLIGGSANVVDCLADSGVHGSNATPSPNFFARNGSAAAMWSSLSSAVIDWSQRTTYNFYTANWLNWYRVEPADRTVSRAQAVENAVVNLVSSVDDVNMGMMRFNLGENPATTAENAYWGGLVLQRVQDITQSRDDLIAKITDNSAAGYSAASLTMLSETLYEAYRYWSGQDMWSGNFSGRDASATSGTTYISPITSTCQNNYEIIITDGRPTWDSQADSRVGTLIGGTCDGPDPGDGGNNPPNGYNDRSEARDGRCLDDLAGYLHNANTDLRTGATLPGNQNVTTYTIGIGGDVRGADFLSTVASEGGGRRYDATNSSDLLDIFDDIAGDILNVSTTFSTASVSVNAFNRTASRNELYFALFSPEEKVRWDGNLKKYKYAVMDPDGTGPQSPKIIITGQGASPADVISPTTGFFTDTSRSFWSDATDGNNVTAGGAANELPAYAARQMFTFLGTNPAGTATPLVSITDASVTNAVLGTADATERQAVLDFARAKDEARMGDPMHSVPQVVTYGGPTATPVDVAFVATNDGMLHAVNAADLSGGELWSFIPPELLPRLKTLMANASGTHTYGLDGDVRILRYDVNADGTIDAAAGDRVYLYVGMRRGGNYYYALDVTSRTDPKMLFKIGPSELPGIGETWSPPVITRVWVTGGPTQNGQKFVLIFGGGYNAGQEGGTQVDDTTGNRIFMVDAKSGARLWFAGPSGGTPAANLQLASMTNSIPGKITVLDTDGDQLADRMYAADMGGRIFRFDISNGTGANALVAGGVFAALGQGAKGGGSVGSPNIADTRRFYNAPDVALFQSRGSASYMTVSIGSGYRGHPLSRQTVDRFYSLRDKLPFRKMTQAEYNTMTTNAILDNTTGLVDITANPAAAALNPSDIGWKYSFSGNLGEKVLSEATTVGGTVLFTTYQPLDPNQADPCHSRHANRAYAFSLGSGKPALDLNNDGVINNSDLFEQVNHDGILGSVNVVVLRGELLDQYNAACQASGPTACQGEDTTAQGKLICQAGMHIMGRCVPIGEGGRNFWRKKADAGS